MATSSWGDSSALLASAGVKDNPSYYRGFVSPDQKAVLTVAMRIQAAWAANDADRFADTFTENGSLLMQDEQLTSREQIRAFMGQGFQSYFKGAHVNGWPIEVQFLADDVAMVITEGGIVYSGQSDVAPENFIRSTWIIRRQSDGTLRLFSHQSSPVKG